MLKYITIFSLFFSSFLSYTLAENTTTQALDSTTFSRFSFPEKGYVISMHNQTDAINYFNEKAQSFIQKNDTVNYIYCMVGLAYIEQNRGNYNRAFDILWNTLSMIPDAKDKRSVVRLHTQLGILYGVYGKDSLSLEYLKKGLEISKIHNKTVKESSKQINPTYFSVANQYMRMKEYDLALTYLDSSYIENITGKRLHYSDANYGYIYIQQGDYLKAEKYLRGLVPFFNMKPQGYLARVYSFIAELKQKTGEQDSAIYYYEKSLSAINELKVHPEIKPMVLEQLALLYSANNQKEKAFKYMQAAKYMSDSLFNTQSSQNSLLFEIKNRYKEDISKQKDLIDAQNKLIDLKDKASFRLKLFIGILVLFLLISITTLRMKSKIKKMTHEKSTIKEKSDAELELKNKELTLNALQLIEKDHSVTELLEELKNHSPEKHNELSNRYKKNNKKLWDDFNLRFAQVNNKFYERLSELHPDLTPTDLKLCALIKLNFNSKEISQILSISEHGVHTARSRVRKKLNLTRDESLSLYIANL